MIYVITGFPRSGTAMMMQALQAGGMPISYSEARDRTVCGSRRDAWYDPNPAGLFEIEPPRTDDLEFPRQYEGFAIKVLWPGVLRMATHAYQIVLMRRDPEEIRQSLEAFNNRDMSGECPYTATMWLRLRDQLAARPDVRSLHTVDYADAVENPQRTFELLRDAGWPLDSQAAATIVNPTLYRFRLDRLTVGI